MIEAPVSRRGPFAFWRDPGGGRFQGDLSAGNLKATRRQARRFARTGIKRPQVVTFAYSRASNRSADLDDLYEFSPNSRFSKKCSCQQI